MQENYFHLSNEFFSLRDFITQEETERDMKKGEKKKRSEINLKDSNGRPVCYGHIDVGMPVAKGTSE